jgi:hypothetical protein
MRVDIHNINISEAKKFVCNSQLFRKPCRLCEMKHKFSIEKKHNEAKKIELWKFTFLNIIDRANEDKGVKVWMAPISAWWQIEKAAFRNGNLSLILNSSEDGTYGCDLSVNYDPNEQFKNRYKVTILHNDPRPLGTEEQLKKWVEEVLPLKPENFYDVVAYKKLKYVESSIRTFVKKCREFHKRVPLLDAIYVRGAPPEQVKEARRILLALDGLSKEDILKEEHEEFQAELNKLDGDIHTYQWRGFITFVMREDQCKGILESLKKEKQKLVNAYTKKNEEQLDEILKDVESVHQRWMEEVYAKGAGRGIMKLSILRDINKYQP